MKENSINLQTEGQLDDLLTRPSPDLVQAIGKIESPLVILGGSGKMGPSLCVLARKAAAAAGHKLEVIVASRFSDTVCRSWLEANGVKTRPVDLVDPRDMAELPDSSNVVYLVGVKFGTHSNPSWTWAVNTLAPAHVAERYAGSRIVALSTGNVYAFTRVSSGGSTEDDQPAPVGEYGMAALARERIFEYFSRKQRTPTALLRLNYAVELRYGVLRDIAEKVWKEEPVDLTNGYLNCIWQGDANAIVLRCFGLATSPPAVFNLTAPGVLSVRELAEHFATFMGRKVRTTGAEAQTALLSNPARLCAMLGAPPTPLNHVIEWTARWVMQGGSSLGKPTHFEERTGSF